jgi:hypothetical protein
MILNISQVTFAWGMMITRILLYLGELFIVFRCCFLTTQSLSFLEYDSFLTAVVHQYETDAPIKYVDAQTLGEMQVF